ncbi:MAG TPA: hypothetical protein VG711_00015 [Phycisphaerales bacterium]|nr:hypothetical protein [Phycisphaerales bacterium]
MQTEIMDSTTQHTQKPAMNDAWMALRLGEVLACAIWLGCAVVGIHQAWWWTCLIAGVLSVGMMRVGSARRSWMIEAYGFLFVNCAALIAIGAMRDSEWWMLVGAGGYLVVGASIPIAGRSPNSQASMVPPEISSRLADVELALHRVRETVAMSDAAKRVVNQDHELEMIRGAIGEAIARGDFATGLRLCDGIEEELKLPHEAQVIRDHIHAMRDRGEQKHVASEIQQLDAILLQQDWGAAYQHAARVRQLNQDPQLSMEMEQRILQARMQYGKELQSRFLEAAHKNDLSQAMALLKELDRYMTREEAASIAGVAQDVVVRYRESLSVQFKLAVSEHRWKEAVILGDQITLEFPNTKMADEVRQMIVVLRQRAQGTEAHAVSSAAR